MSFDYDKAIELIASSPEPQTWILQMGLFWADPVLSKTYLEKLEPSNLDRDVLSVLYTTVSFFLGPEELHLDIFEQALKNYHAQPRSTFIVGFVLQQMLVRWRSSQLDFTGELQGECCEIWYQDHGVEKSAPHPRNVRPCIEEMIRFLELHDQQVNQLPNAFDYSDSDSDEFDSTSSSTDSE